MVLNGLYVFRIYLVMNRRKLYCHQTVHLRKWDLYVRKFSEIFRSLSCFIMCFPKSSVIGGKNMEGGRNKKNPYPFRIKVVCVSQRKTYDVVWSSIDTRNFKC